MKREVMKGNQAKRSRFWCSSENKPRKKLRGTRVDGLRVENENVHHSSMTDDSLSDVEKISRGDYQYVFGLWSDLDQQFWGDDEKDSDSSDYQMNNVANERRDFGTCHHCHAPIIRLTKYCCNCYQNRWRWLPQRPTRSLRRKEVSQDQRKEAGTMCKHSKDDIISRRARMIPARRHLPLPRDYSDLTTD